MGANHSVPRNLDKTTARCKHREHFVRAVEEWRAAPGSADDGAMAAEAGEHGKVAVVVRKRPLAARELQRGDFDVVSARGCYAVLHDFRMLPDMRRMKVTHSMFPFSAVFDENASTEAVFQLGFCRENVRQVCAGAMSSATVCLFGQTGAGKTYSNLGLLALVAAELEQLAAFPLDLTCLEIGERCVDLLAAGGSAEGSGGGGGGVEVALREDAQGHVQPCNAHVAKVTSTEHMAALLHTAQAQRVSRGTASNPDGSSRAHGVFQVRVANGGVLTFVDLAGSEMRHDSAQHDAALRKQGALINTSLLCLKECIRLRAQASAHIPYRRSKLTMVLRDSFTSDSAHLLLLLAVSPASRDTEHTLNTLRHGAMLLTARDHVRVETREVPCAAAASVSMANSHVNPVNWTHDQMKKWMRRLRKGKFADAADRLPASFDGKAMSRAGVVQVARVLRGDRAAADLLIDLFRKARAKHRDLVEKERKNRQQMLQQ